MILQPAQKVENLSPITGPLKESTLITCTADAGAYEVTTVTCPATADATQADYFYFEMQDGTDFAVWLDIDDNGTTPTGAVYTGATNKVEVDIATGDEAADVAGKVKTAIEADGSWADVTIVDNNDGTLTFTQDNIGATVDAEPQSADDSGDGSFDVTINTQGADSDLQSTYFEIVAADSDAYYPWFNVGNEGSDPSGTGTAAEVDISAGATAEEVATALASVINGLSDFYAKADRNQVSMSAVETGDTTDVADEDTGFTFTKRNDGADGSYYPAMSPADISNTPSLIS